jgi:AmiR/NasT family two-component response regulator
MPRPGLDAIVQAQQTLMTEHDVTSETALSLLVWAATDRGTTVLDVALTICEASRARPEPHEAVHATA